MWYPHMALESLSQDIFSSESDVWAFGITMWELFTLGCEPYPTISNRAELLDYLNKGHRMSEPTYLEKPTCTPKTLVFQI